MNKRIFNSYNDLPKCPIPQYQFYDTPFEFNCPQCSYYSLILKPNYNFSVLSVGCSFAAADGVGENNKWPFLVSNKIEEKYNYNALNLNLGLGATSNDYISRIVDDITHRFDIDLVVILFTWINRREFMWHTGDYIKYGPWFDHIMKDDNPYKDFYEAQNEYDDKNNFDFNFKFVTRTLQLRKINYLYGFADQFNIDNKYFKYENCFGIMNKIDVIEHDKFHPGPKSNHKLAKMILSKIQQLRYAL